ncbi:hypothetical protein [Saccharothrix sp. ALI-22-I]|uniref:hypothetical protein n=1 Tax=Saccharothrix sp. ALI-22-I TaxID=1933778 RepID=UPI00117AE78E|nr:hypothetical protein [Saccharothrix sp. ALI-22-I]
MKKRLFTAAAAAVAVATVIGYGMTTVGAAADSDSESATRPPACATPPPPTTPPTRPPAKPTTVTTIGQAYYCILANYYSGPVLDNRTLLLPAFAALTRELQRRGLDLPNATMPALTGRKDADWAAFSRVYQQITAALPADAAVRQAVAEVTMRAWWAASTTTTCSGSGNPSVHHADRHRGLRRPRSRPRRSGGDIAGVRHPPWPLGPTPVAASN